MMRILRVAMPVVLALLTATAVAGIAARSASASATAAAIGVLAAGWFTSWLCSRSGQFRQPPAVDNAAGDAQLTADRNRLVEELILFSDELAPDFAERAVAALTDAGVERHSVDGELFDPSMHQAVGTEPAARQRDLRRIARTERASFRDRGVTLTRALVVVYVDATNDAANQLGPR